MLGGMIGRLLLGVGREGTGAPRIGVNCCPTSASAIHFSIVEDFSHPLVRKGLLSGLASTHISARLS